MVIGKRAFIESAIAFLLFPKDRVTILNQCRWGYMIPNDWATEDVVDYTSAIMAQRLAAEEDATYMGY